MAYDSRVYRVLIASPSDVEEEREIAVRVIQEWNDLYSYSRKVALLPLRWETHTAPEYGVRPQEVINRAIVDQCDLLVGIFWTRMGSPTGVAESGTLEEIERVGNAGKPVMLYFSRVEIDPERIELNQIEKLKQFREKTYPRGLVETYKKVIEFRDKFAKQLELKIRDLQRSDASGDVPVSLEFLSLETGEPEGNQTSRAVDLHFVEDFSSVAETDREEVAKLAVDATRARGSLPIPLVVRNSSASGIRNLYVELDFSESGNSLALNQGRFGSGSYPWAINYDILQSFYGREDAPISRSQDFDLQRFDADKLQKIDGGWRLSFEWEALQPQRTRLIKPVVYVYGVESTQLNLRARVFADSFAEPIELKANIDLNVKKSVAPLDELLPRWEGLLEKSRKRGVLSIRS